METEIPKFTPAEERLRAFLDFGILISPMGVTGDATDLAAAHAVMGEAGSCVAVKTLVMLILPLDGE
jgi:hypothetical protein